MESEETTGLKLELKYCEGCGALLAREVGSGTTYCAGCRRQLVEMELPRFVQSRPRTVAKLQKLQSLAEFNLALANCGSYRPQCFEDAVIFVTDVERCLQKLGPFAQLVVARVVLQEYSEVEAAGLIGCCERTVRGVLGEALDDLAEIFLRKGLLRP
jgi:DNA-directed RNA polymerase specialized sigma24 family protein